MMKQVKQLQLAASWQKFSWIWRLAWSTAPHLLTGFLLTTFFEGLLPAALALTGRGLINTLVAGLQPGAALNHRLLLWLMLGATLAVSNVIVSNLGDYWQQRLQEEIDLRVGVDVLAQANRLDLAFLESRAGQNRSEHARRYGSNVVAQVLFKLVLCTNLSVRLCSLVGILFWIEPWVVIWLSLLALPYLLFKWRLAGRSYTMLRRRTKKQRWTFYYTQLLTHPRWLTEVKFLQLAPLFIERFRALSAEFMAEDQRLYRLTLLGNLAFGAAGAIGLYALFGRIAGKVSIGVLTVGDVAIYISSTMQLQNTVQSLVQTIAALNEQLLHLSDLQTFLALQPAAPMEHKQRPDKASPASANGHLSFTQPPSLPASQGASGVIEFNNVSFTYPGHSEPVLAHLSFRLEPGETVALVGENGAGKSTLAKLLARLYEPTAGSIRFAGVDLREFDRQAWQAQMGFVFQDFTFYEATVHENIAYGQWSLLRHQPDRVEQLARLAQADAFIQQLPQGYDTLLGKFLGSHELSIGQWQRLAIARGLAHPAARLLILDEPSASLDARAEYELFNHFREVAAGRTTLLISHRFSTISMADRILVLEKGRIVECGTHEALLAQGGHYATLYHLHQQQYGSFAVATLP